MTALRVVITGSECAGKTTLAARLAARFDAPWSEEFARHYQQARSEPLVAADVEPIACGQLELENQAIQRADVSGLVIHDTDLVSSLVYARHYYGACPEWLEPTVRERRADLYLLCHPDVPWLPDGLQRDSPGRRQEIHDKFRAALDALDVLVVDVTGAWNERDAVATRAVGQLLSRAEAAPR